MSHYGLRLVRKTTRYKLSPLQQKISSTSLPQAREPELEKLVKVILETHTAMLNPNDSTWNAACLLTRPTLLLGTLIEGRKKKDIEDGPPHTPTLGPLRINTTPNLALVQDPAVLDGALIPRTSAQPHPQDFSVGLQTDDNWTPSLI